MRAWCRSTLAAVTLAALVVAVMPNDIPDWAQQVGDFRQLLATDTNAVLPHVNPTFTTAPGGTANPQLTLKPGIIEIRIHANAGGVKFTYQLAVFGRQSSNQYYGDPSAIGSPITVQNPSSPLTIPISRDIDTQLLLSVVGDPTSTVNYYVSELTTPEVPGQSAPVQAVTMVTPQLWQSPTNNLFGFQAGIGTTVLLAGTAGQTIRLWDGVLDILTAAAGAQCAVQDTAGNVLAQAGAADRKTVGCGFTARTLIPGNGVQIVVAGGAATGQFAAGYSKG